MLCRILKTKLKKSEFDKTCKSENKQKFDFEKRCKMQKVEQYIYLV